MVDERHDTAFVVGALVGGAIGAVYALLNAPQSGQRTRSQLTGQVDAVTQQALNGAHGVQQRTKGAVDTVSSGAANRASSVASAMPTEALSRAGSVVQAVTAGAASTASSVSRAVPTDALSRAGSTVASATGSVVSKAAGAVASVSSDVGHRASDAVGAVSARIGSGSSPEETIVVVDGHTDATLPEPLEPDPVTAADLLESESDEVPFEPRGVDLTPAEDPYAATGVSLDYPPENETDRSASRG